MPDIFETADIHVALGGDMLNTVPRFGVTAGEIAVLQVIHGNDAIHDIIPTGQIVRPQRVERERLKSQYAMARNNDGRAHVETIYPGAAARIFERLDELVLDDSQFKAVPMARGNPAIAAERQAIADAAGEAVNESNANQPKPKRVSKKAAAAAAAAAVEDDGDEVEELPADDTTGVLD